MSALGEVVFCTSAANARPSRLNSWNSDACEITRQRSRAPANVSEPTSAHEATRRQPPAPHSHTTTRATSGTDARYQKMRTLMLSHTHGASVSTLATTKQIKKGTKKRRRCGGTWYFPRDKRATPVKGIRNPVLVNQNQSR